MASIMACVVIASPVSASTLAAASRALAFLGFGSFGPVLGLAWAGAAASDSALTELVGSGAISAAAGSAAASSGAGGTAAAGGGSLATGVSGWNCGSVGADTWTSGASASFAAFLVLAAWLGCLWD